MEHNLDKLDFRIDTLGARNIKSPIELSGKTGDFKANFRSPDEHIIYQIEHSKKNPTIRTDENLLIERAGAYEKIFFDPKTVHAAIVTCGGLCPGLNDVIRSLVMALWYRYGVRKISGIQFGYRGLLDEYELPLLELTPEKVSLIHNQGGTILGSSRGNGERTIEMADKIEKEGINILFALGGDGTQRAALDIYEELKKRGKDIAVVGIPKTIDNDLSFSQKSFGFETAVASAVDAVAGAHIEAKGYVNGIGLVKVMGRDSGFIAAHTALANNDVNYVLVPEVPFELEGENGLFAHLEKRIKQSKHAVILVAEGAGQNILNATNATDGSGNRKLSDIGTFLSDKIKAHFKEKNIELNLKYIDPSYIIRSQPANANDSLYCARLGTSAVHAAMAGKTGMLITLLHGHYVHIPIKTATSAKHKINPDRSLWRDVIEATGQPILMTNE